MLTPQLSTLTENDIPAVEKLERSTGLAFWGRENYRKFLRDYPEYFGTKAVIYAQPGETIFAGFVLSRSIFENLEILKVGVDPHYHRRGIGSLLMKAAYSEGIRRGCLRCFLEVRRSNLAALSFYSRQKFIVAGVRRNYYSDPIEDAMIMERTF